MSSTMNKTPLLRMNAVAHAAQADGARLKLVESPDRAASRLHWAAMKPLVERRVRLARGVVVVSPGQPFDGLVLVRVGSCKCSVTGSHGLEQITGYHIAGELVASEAIATGVHDATITALEDSEFWLVPLDRLQAAARADGALQQHLCAYYSDRTARDRAMMVMLGTMRAEQRLASFLLDLADRYRASGYSSRAFVLRMTRQEIGLHLGLSVETVSRLFTRLHEEGLIRLQRRTVELLDRDGLVALRDDAA
jgi:CRP/FNR family transcriptional regulator